MGFERIELKVFKKIHLLERIVELSLNITREIKISTFGCVTNYCIEIT